MSSYFSEARATPLTALIEVCDAFKSSISDKKVDLSIGVYKSEDNTEWILPVVKKVARSYIENELSFFGLPALGLESFTSACTKLVLGTDNKAIKEGRVFGVQTPGCAGAISLGMRYLFSNLNHRIVYIPDVNYENHRILLDCSGFRDIRTYRNWDSNKKCFDFNGMYKDIHDAPENCVVLLHAVAHNPTGCDPTRDQWKKIAEIIQDRDIFTFFDFAYQGLASGNLEEDSWVVKYFVDQGFELFCCQSFSKNFGLYGERVGNLICVLNSPKYVTPVKSQLTRIIKGIHSYPANFGARIVSTILNNPEYYEEFKNCIKIMHKRIVDMRKELRKKLEEKKTPGTWKHITEQVGMFAYTNFTDKQIKYLLSKDVYLIPPGRINVCGLNHHNIDYVADCIFEAVTQYPHDGAKYA